jgi:tetratricopeptide (TPR) repeat protein
MTVPAAGPSIAQAYALAATHHRAGRFHEAEVLYRQILARQPDHADTLHMLGLLAHQAGHHDDALQLIRRAIELNPNVGEYHGHLGLVYRALRQSDAELAAYQRAVELRPDVPEAHYNLGAALGDRERFGEAIVEYQRALALWPQFPEAHNNLGHALREIGQFDEGLAECRRALELRPDFPDALNNLSTFYEESNRLKEAVEACQKALSIRPNYLESLNTLGTALRMSGRVDESIAALRHALQLQPNSPETMWNLAHALLYKDHTLEGWHLYEARRGLRRRYIGHEDPATEWLGGDVAGKRLLLHSEQGFGDMIQMARYIPLLAARGATIFLEVQPELVQLMRGVSGVQQVIARGEPPPQYDLHAPIMSLPLRFGTTTLTVPANVPYIRVEPQKKEQWRQRFQDAADRLKVGLMWSGRPKPRNRSIATELLSPLAKIGNVCFYSLQKRDRETPPGIPPGLALVDLSPHLHDFTDTAAALASLDLLITIDTASAHLAGALGRPAWVLLQFTPDWRWLINRTDSPWYPSLQLFRQPNPGDWRTPLGQVTEKLAELSRKTMPPAG